jgi:hypothetical protein
LLQGTYHYSMWYLISGTSEKKTIDTGVITFKER